jgi:hypothetical protein
MPAPRGKNHPNWKEKIDKVCPVCGTGFDVIPSQKHLKCCTHKCSGKLRLGKNNPFYNKKHSQATKDKMKLNHPDISGEKNPMFGMVGENCPAYKDGRGYEPYPMKFNKKLKEFIRRRDGYKCQKCGRTELEEKRKLAIHHIDGEKDNCSLDNLITLCHKCNMMAIYKGEKWTRYFQKKLERACKKEKQLCFAI